MVFNNNLLMGAAAAASGGDAAFVPKGAIQLNGTDEYLHRTPSSTGTPKVQTFSFWAKINEFTSGAGCAAIAAWADDSNHSYIDFNGGGEGALRVATQVSGGNKLDLQTSVVFRDPTAWYHWCVIWDFTNTLSSERGQIYRNGVRITGFGTETYPATSDVPQWATSGTAETIGIASIAGGYWYADIYLSDFVRLDGYAGSPSDFAQYDSNGLWVPKDPTDIVTANKGTNGFWLDFADSSDLGNDVSSGGTDNSFTSVNMGTANSVLDRPADDAATNVGNYATITTLYTREVNSLSSPAGAITTSNGNLTVNFANGGTNPLCITTQPLLPGNKYHFEWESNAWGSNATQPWAGVWLIPLSSLYTLADINTSGGYAWYISTWTPARGITSNTAFNGSSLTTIAAADAWTVGAIMSVDIDMSTIGSTDIISKKDGSTIATDSSLAFLDEPYFICPQVQSNGADRTWNGTFNFGQHAFTTTPVTDHGGVLTTKISEPTVKNGENNFLPMIYEGNGGGQRVGNFIPFTDSHTVNNSCMFEDADSDHMNRTFVTPTSAYKWTFSTWFKRGKLGEITFIGQGDYNGVYTALHFNGSDQFQFQERGSGVWNTLLTSNRQFKDTSNWHNLVLAYDTATSTTATKVYIDGGEITSWAAETNPTSTNTASSWNSAGTAWIGEVPTNTPGYYMDGYLAETMFIDGYALSASVFGQTDTSTNRWIPKEVTTATINTAGGGSSGWGNNGFYLAYGTDSALGDDTSGEGHDWTVNNITSANQTDDTPTQNYSTMNPNNSGSGITLANGNLKASDGLAADATFSTLKIPDNSGKWYWEMTINAWDVNNGAVGIIPATSNGITDSLGSGSGDFTYGIYTANNSGLNGYLIVNGASGADMGDYAVTDRVNVCYDSTNHNMYLGKNGTYWGSANPSAGTGANITDILAVDYYVAMNINPSTTQTINFGATSFTDSVPTNAKHLNQDNLAENTAGITGFSWIKNRAAAVGDSHILQDRVRGIYNYISSNNSDLEAANTNSVQRFLQQGVQIGNMDAVNTAAESYVFWQWVANGAGTLNEVGSIDSTVSANTDAGFSIVKYTGTGSAATVGHGLSSAPTFILNKTLGSGSTDPNWQVYHVGLGPTKAMFLNTTGAPATSSSYWNNTAPTSTVFSIGTDRDSATDYINYCWADVEGYSKFGSYTGNGVADGPVVYLGFNPSWIMFKNASQAGYGWNIYDTARTPFNPTSTIVPANYASGDSTVASYKIDLLAGGFKIRGNSGETNYSGNTIIYAAFASHPFGGSGVGQARAE